MKHLIAILAATTALSGAVQAQDITEFNIGILGGENAQDRLTNQECFRAKIEEALGVPTKLFAPADYDGVIQGLLGGTIDYQIASTPGVIGQVKGGKARLLAVSGDKRLAALAERFGVGWQPTVRH